MVSAGDGDFWVTSWGWRGVGSEPGRVHRVWRVRWVSGRPGMLVVITGPRDVDQAVLLAWSNRERLPWVAES